MPLMSALQGTPAEHAEALGVYLDELPPIIAEALAAFRRGDCLRAGSVIDHGYRVLGRASAEASWLDDAAQRRVAAMRKRLVAADEPFERRCVRKEPLTEGQAQVFRATALAGVGSRWTRCPGGR